VSRPRPDPRKRAPAEPASAGHPGDLRMDLPATHSAVRMARKVIRRYAASGGIRGKDSETLILVASELLSNAVDHGGGKAAMFESDLETPVRMSLTLALRGRGWELTVADQGGGDPAVVEALLHPGGPPDLEDERGRGFFLLTQMVDRLSVKRSLDGLGLVVTAVCEPTRSRS
jgi:anti-sigma regulatory factor (Ser/Thr protein kinase)